MIYLLSIIICWIVLLVEFAMFSGGRVKAVEVFFITVVSFLPWANICAPICALCNIYVTIKEKKGGAQL